MNKMNTITKFLLVSFIVLLTPALTFADGAPDFAAYVPWVGQEQTRDGIYTIAAYALFPAASGSSSVDYASSTVPIKIPEGSNFVSFNIRSGTATIYSATTEPFKVSGAIMGGTYHIMLTPRWADTFAGNVGATQDDNAAARAIGYVSGATVIPVYNLRQINSATGTYGAAYANPNLTYQWLQDPSITNYGTYNHEVGENGWMTFTRSYSLSTRTTTECITIKFSRYRYSRR